MVRLICLRLSLLLSFIYIIEGGRVLSRRSSSGSSDRLPESCPFERTLDIDSDCPRNCTTDLDCPKENRGQCICFGQCGLSCVDDYSDFCNSPGPIANGKILFVGPSEVHQLPDEDSRVPVGTHILFECHKGYILTDGPLGKICEEKKKWTPSGTPRCKKIDAEWFLTSRSKRRAIKPGGSVVRNANNKSGGGAGGVGTRRGFKKKSSRPGEVDEYEMAPIFCPSLEDFDEYMQIQVIQPGSYENETFSAGAVVKVSCNSGFGVNVPNETVRCDKGRWKPKVPQCSALPCKTPYIDHGLFYEESKALYFQEIKKHKTVVNVKCAKGYILKGPERFSCHYGEWDVQESPECITGGNWSTKETCGKPQRVKGAYVYEAGLPINWEKSSFQDSTEVLYRCANLTPKTKNRWKVTCNNGRWEGWGNFSCSKDGEAPADKYMSLPIISMVNGSCAFKKPHFNVMTFHNHQVISQDGIELPHGSKITSRCMDIGKFRLDGAVNRKCLSGQWMGVTPKCEGLSQVHDYASDKSPTVLFRFVNGSIVQSTDGDLVVYPGTTVHMECLWIRKFGLPKWEWENKTKNKEYHQGWADEPGRDKYLEYRITIENAQESDSGTYSCVTPTRHINRIRVIIKAAECPPLPVSPELEYSSNDTILGARVTFTCKHGNKLVGDEEVFCSEVGQWSAPLPRCENVECHDISLIPAMGPLPRTSITRNGTQQKNDSAPPKISVDSTRVGGRANFSCPQGYMIEGAHEAFCNSSGEWSTSIPLCKEVECPNPPDLENGHSTGTPPYKSGDLTTYECDGGYRMEGQHIIVCQESGKWSKPSNGMKCKISCSDPARGSMGGLIQSPQPKFKQYYEIGETITFDCAQGYDLFGSRMIHCLKTGKWSNAIPTCTPSNFDHVSNFNYDRS